MTNTSYIMPGEFEKHHGCIMIWPIRPGSWIHNGKDAKKTFCEIAQAIAQDEKLYMLTDHAHINEAKEMLSNTTTYENMQVIEIESDDAWARDVGPTFVRDLKGKVYGINWSFNAWGGTYDGLYANWDKDDLVAKKFCKLNNYPVLDAAPFVLEGGSIHSDGIDTLITTEACLLSPGRNPNLSKTDIENKLKSWLGIKKIIWLPHGIYNDETNEHVDNVCAFVKPGVVVLAWCDDEDDPQYAYSKEAYDILTKEGLEVIKLPIPKKHVCITKEECEGYVFEEGEDMREPGERLAASYVNFYISNNSIIVPQFDDEKDSVAIDILSKAFPERKIIPVFARSIIVGGGNIHCITQQIPEEVIK